jgi:hypothetical protein
MKVRRQLVTHTFKGKRFEDHGLDLDVLPDLYAYKELLAGTAKELWKRHHPDRHRLPKNFEDSLCLKFFDILEGSVAVPIFREIETVGQPVKPIREVIEEIGAAVPVAEWDKVPADGARNLDHYLYGHAKNSS